MALRAWRLAGMLCMLHVAACGSSGNGAAPPDASPSDAPTDSTRDADAGPGDDGPTLGDASPEAACPPAPSPDGGTPITVHGTVFSIEGVPVNVNVTIQGQTVNTSAAGTFTIPGVYAPYDVLIDDVVFSDHLAYIGLTRPDPSLVAGSSQPPMPWTHQSVSGTVTAGGAAVDAGPPSMVGAVIGADVPGAFADGELGAPAFSLAAGWPSSAPESVGVWGFTLNQLPSGGVAAFTAVGSQTLTLDGGADLTGVNVAISSSGFTPTTLSGTLHVPSGETPNDVSLYLGHGPQLGLSFGADQLADASTFAYGTFGDSSLTWALYADANFVMANGNGGQCGVVRQGLTGNENLSLDIPSTTTVVTSPSSQATLPSGCVDFAWTPASATGVLYEMMILGSGTQADAGASGPNTYIVVTDHSPLRIPYSVPPGGYSWLLIEIHQPGGMDGLAASYAAGSVLNDLTHYDYVGDLAWCLPGGDTFDTK